MEESKKVEEKNFVVIILNVIAIICMVLIIGKSFIQKECTNTPSNQSYKYNEMKLSSFNMQFNPYEGIKTGAQVKKLLQTVIASNATYSDDPNLIVTINNVVPTEIKNIRTFKKI